jgi:hypothetical protein
MSFNRKMDNLAVSETIGAIVLLAIAIVIFSVIYINVLVDDGPDLYSFLTIEGETEKGEAIFEHMLGEGIGTDSRITIFYGDENNLFDSYEGPIKYLLNPINNGDDVWNIGEKLSYKPSSDIIPLEFLDDIQISSTIADIHTNSLVFWGILQEGYTGGIGGVWHLDENTGNIAHDSTCNKNHGDIHDSKWISGINSSSALMFNAESTDYVNVSSKLGLYITESITVEAWFNPVFISGGVGDSLELGDNAQDITWVHISGDIFTFALWRSGGQTSLDIQTINLSQYCAPNDKLIDSITFNRPSGANGFDPDFIHINGSVYAFAHRWSQDDGYVTTLNISDNGTIADDIIDRVTFEPDPAANAFRSDIIHVSGNIYAIASTEHDIGGPGNLVTLEIAPNGSINETVIDRFEFESGNCSRPRMHKIFDTNYVIAYSRSDSGFVKTIEIEDNGSINKTMIDSFLFESNRCFESDLVYVSSNPSDVSNIYAIAYRGVLDNGYVITIEVKNNGSITNNTISNLKFDPSIYGGQPNIIATNYTNLYAIAYLGPKKSGYLTTIKIFNNGSILNNTIDTIQFTREGWDSNLELEPAIVHVKGDIYGIAYKGHAGQGFLVDFSMNESGGFGPIEGYGGIVKDNSYYLTVNKTMAFASINNITINSRGITANIWNHVALTYDGSEICLYINGIKTKNYAYNKKIYFSADDDLYFGWLYLGGLDEIAIYNYALTLIEIESHYNNPEILHSYDCNN